LTLVQSDRLLAQKWLSPSGNSPAEIAVSTVVKIVQFKYSGWYVSGKKKPPYGGFFESATAYCLAGSEAAGAAASAAAGAAAGASVAAGAAGAAAGASVAAGAGAGISSFLPQAAKAAAAINAAKTRDLFIFSTRVS
jgi:hypothetical protein